MQDQPTTQARKPGTWQAAVTLALGILTPCTLGLAGIPGTLFGIYALWRGGFRIMTAIGLILSLLLGGLLMTTITGPYLWAQVSPRYAASRLLKDHGHLPLPSTANDVKHAGGGPKIIPFVGTSLWVAATCSPDQAKAYLDAAPSNTGRVPIGPDFDPIVSHFTPDWYTPDDATTGWYLYSDLSQQTPNGQQGSWCEMTYDDQTGLLYILVFRY